MIHQKVQVWIYRKINEGIEVLLLQLKPERGGFWQPVTGGVDPGESLEHAAQREATEESGLEFTGAPVSLDYQFGFEARGATFEEHVFALEASGGSTHQWSVRLDPNEHVVHAWLSPRQAFAQVKHPSNAEGLKRLLVKLKQGEK